MQHLTAVDRIIAGLGAAYFAYRLWSGWSDGVIYGDGDEDVRAASSLIRALEFACLRVVAYSRNW